MRGKTDDPKPVLGWGHIKNGEGRKLRMEHNLNDFEPLPRCAHP